MTLQKKSEIFLQNIIIMKLQCMPLPANHRQSSIINYQSTNYYISNKC